MTETTTDIQPHRIDNTAIEENFSDLHPPLSRSEALIEADRCYFCFDAPCTAACPTGIDIPRFIQMIRSDNVRGSAKTILDENIMGGMCARVCPTEVLCEEACVRNAHEDKPVEIGRLQRYATDPVLAGDIHLFTRGQATGKQVAVVGGGPAGLSCAHRLAMLGHNVAVYSRDDKLGGLNEYGIAAYKAVDDFAQKEVDWILSIGGIEHKCNVALGKDFTLTELRNRYDAVFLAIGLSGVNALGLDDRGLSGVENAVDYIADLRQAEDKSALPVGRHVVVVGGGMTAIDIAIQSKRLGAEHVDIVYRRGPQEMGASQYEQHLAHADGVKIHHWAMPVRLLGDGHVSGIELERTSLDISGRLRPTGQTYTLRADVVFKAIGQKLEDAGDELSGLEIRDGKIVVDEHQATSVKGVWAGGDCASDGDDLTVVAVQHGKIAAMAIDEYLRG